MFICLFNTSIGGIIGHEFQVVKIGAFAFGLYSQNGDFVLMKYDGNGTIGFYDSDSAETIVNQVISNGDRVGFELDLSTNGYRIILENGSESDIHSGTVAFSGDCAFSEPSVSVSCETIENGFSITSYSSGAKDVHGVTI